MTLFPESTRLIQTSFGNIHFNFNVFLLLVLSLGKTCKCYEYLDINLLPLTHCLLIVATFWNILPMYGKSWKGNDFALGKFTSSILYLKIFATTITTIILIRIIQVAEILFSSLMIERSRPRQ